MRWLIAATVACTVGAAALIALAAGSRLAIFGAICLGGTAFVLAISAAFYAIGRSEDRERARARSVRQPDERAG